MLARITSLFPVWALLFSLSACAWPQAFVGAKPMIVPLLGIVMLGMGMTLTWGNFTEVLRRPAAIGLGVALQYLVMPFLAWVIALLLDLLPVSWLDWCCWGHVRAGLRRMWSVTWRKAMWPSRSP